MTLWDRAGAAGKWLRDDFAEWVVGSWAKILAWTIVGVIFVSFLEMDGYFSRGLGEGSGVNPDLFQHIGWMFRLFAVVFLVLAVKFTALGMKDESVKLKALGTFCTIVVIAHAMGFGLKALEGKRSNAVAVSEVAETVTQSNDTVIATLTAQKDAIRADLSKQVAPLEAEIRQYITDGKNNDHLAESTRARRTALEDNAQSKIDAIDAEILRVTSEAGSHKAEATQAIVTTEKWAPLFVGLAQLFTWNANPDDWAIYLAGVIFLMCWILLGDAICIFVPPALYKMHLRDTQKKRFADMGAKGGRTTARRRRVNDKLLQIEDYSAEKRKTAVDMDEDAPPEPEADDLTEDTETEDKDDGDQYPARPQAAE